jgi:hypothetical protein
MSEHPPLNDNATYYAARAIEARRLAMAAKDPHARAVHVEMAEKYAQLAGEGEAASAQATGDQQEQQSS